jgi:glycosyltransferase involved in cell wall biosynthesis
MCYNTAHLLARTLETLKKQNFSDWELIIVDDMSGDDVLLTLRQSGQGLPFHYHRLEHDMGMRGNTFSLNYGISNAIGEVVMWSTPEVMLPPGALRAMYETHDDGLLWVTIPSHGLTAGLQLRIDEVDWKSDLGNIRALVNVHPPDHWDSIWFYLNFYEDGLRDGTHKLSYGNNQTVSVNREKWLDTIGSFPLFADYGSDDPWISNRRREAGYTDVTLWDQEAYHQWHPTCAYWIARGKAPNWNAQGHTISNLVNDPRVPQGGTCEIWDGGSHLPLTEAQIANALTQKAMVIATGFKEKAR